jgi:hypothetical protein
VADTEQLGEGKRNRMCEAFSTLEKQRYDNAGEGVTPQTIARAIREWLFAPDVPSDKLDWVNATRMGEWIRTPLCTAKTAEKYLADGREMRFVPTHRQVLPHITYHGKIPESHQGWTDNYLCRPKKDKTAPGVYTFMHLHQRGDAVTCARPIGDGLVCNFCFKVQVILEGVSYDGFSHALGGVFYQAAVEIVALLIRAEPMAKMVSGRDQVSTGMGVKIFPPELWANATSSIPNNWPSALNAQ